MPPSMHMQPRTMSGQQGSSPHVDNLRSCLAALGGAENKINGVPGDGETRQPPNMQPPPLPLPPTPPSVAKRRLCHRCSRLAFFLCSGCRNVWYCSQHCQVCERGLSNMTHWCTHARTHVCAHVFLKSTLMYINVARTNLKFFFLINTNNVPIIRTLQCIQMRKRFPEECLPDI